MLAMLAIRQWDLIKSTSVRARDALSVFPASTAEPFLKASGVPDVITLVDSIFPASTPTANWFYEWKRLFVGTNHFEPSEALSLIGGDDIVGWTFANTLRRAPLDGSLRDALVLKLETSPSSTVRWRIVHALGLDPDANTAAALEKALTTDVDRWVRYGAIRALIEIAVLGDSQLRASVMQWIRDRADELFAQDRVIRELKASLVIDPKKAPGDWLKQSMSVVETFHELEASIDGKRLWERLGYDLRGLYDPD